MLGASNVSSSSLPYLSICNVDRTTDSQAHHAAIERSSLIHIDYFVHVLYRRDAGHQLCNDWTDQIDITGLGLG